MHVCMHICMPACMHVRMYAGIRSCLHVCMHVHVHVCMPAIILAHLHVHMCAGMYLFMSVRIERQCSLESSAVCARNLSSVRCGLGLGGHRRSLGALRQPAPRRSSVGHAIACGNEPGLAARQSTATATTTGTRPPSSCSPWATAASWQRRQVLLQRGTSGRADPARAQLGRRGRAPGRCSSTCAFRAHESSMRSDPTEDDDLRRPRPLQLPQHLLDDPRELRGQPLHH